MLAKNEGILAPKPLGRGIWRDFYALFPGDLEGFCLIVKRNPRGLTPGKANDKCIKEPGSCAVIVLSRVEQL